MKNHFAWSAGIVGVLLLAGCGGGSSDPPVVVLPPTQPVPVTEVPASAGANTTAYLQYALGLLTSETTESLGTDLVVTAPSSESDEPIVIN